MMRDRDGKSFPCTFINLMSRIDQDAYKEVFGRGNYKPVKQLWKSFCNYWGTENYPTSLYPYTNYHPNT